VERSGAAVRAATEPLPAGVERLCAGARDWVRWAVENPALAQLLCWRVVPGFAPADETFAVSVAQMQEARADFDEAVRRGRLRPEAASAEAARLYTAVLNGVITQQMADQPGADYGSGIFSSLTEGRGLHIVCALSDQWGCTTPGDAGKVVWAMFRSPPPPRSSARYLSGPRRDRPEPGSMVEPAGVNHRLQAGRGRNIGRWPATLIHRSRVDDYLIPVRSRSPP